MDYLYKLCILLLFPLFVLFAIIGSSINKCSEKLSYAIQYIRQWKPLQPNAQHNALSGSSKRPASINGPPIDYAPIAERKEIVLGLKRIRTTNTQRNQYFVSDLITNRVCNRYQIIRYFAFHIKRCEKLYSGHTKWGSLIFYTLNPTITGIFLKSKILQNTMLSFRIA